MMKLTKSAALLEYKLVSGFEQLQRKLNSEQFADRLEKPLAYWVLPNDRHLPLAFMSRTAQDILSTPFDALYSTPGIGQKKIMALLELLERAASQDPPGVASPPPPPVEAESPRLPLGAAPPAIAIDAPVDTSIISEALWAQWRVTVTNHGLEKESLGRFAVSLRDLPRVIWNAPLETYSNMSLADIRSMKVHGAKRLNAILSVFGTLHKMLTQCSAPQHLAMQVQPRFLVRVENWVNRVIRHDEIGNPADIRTEFVDPLVEQVRIDAGDHIAKLVIGRLGLEGRSSNVQRTARQLGLTRARVYQLLQEASDVINTRWPEGQPLLHKVREIVERCSLEESDRRRFDGAIDLFFPEMVDAEKSNGKRDRASLPAAQGDGAQDTLPQR